MGRDIGAVRAGLAYAGFAQDDFAAARVDAGAGRTDFDAALARGIAPRQKLKGPDADRGNVVSRLMAAGVRELGRIDGLGGHLTGDGAAHGEAPGAGELTLQRD